MRPCVGYAQLLKTLRLANPPHRGNLKNVASEEADAARLSRDPVVTRSADEPVATMWTGMVFRRRWSQTLPSHPGNESHPVGEPWSRGERGLRCRLDDTPKIREAPRLVHPHQRRLRLYQAASRNLQSLKRERDQASKKRRGLKGAQDSEAADQFRRLGVAAARHLAGATFAEHLRFSGRS